MDFETKFFNRISVLLKDQNSNFERELQTVLRNASAKHELGGGNTVRRIMECCTAELKRSIDLLVTTSIEMIELSQKSISSEKLVGILQPHFASQLELINEAKLKALKTNQPRDLSQNVIEASSIMEKYNLFESEAKYRIEKELLVLKENRGKTLKDRIINRLNNSWLYLILLTVFGVFAWLYKG
ncbi:hypothetical protein [Cellvibrio sp. OA-2007]|uniref:hypothetical protein n=1 Tax=Cellvibrio sp. OA-2007 TaxID=529823 RepID=UPI000782A15E|nr:hypothetical protein [Cellvibrio sp. OA-2007]